MHQFSLFAIQSVTWCVAAKQVFVSYIEKVLFCFVLEDNDMLSHIFTAVVLDLLVGYSFQLTRTFY